MRKRILPLVATAALAVPAMLGQGPRASAATAQFYVTGYVLRGYTATGTYTHPGTCAVDPRVIPLGTYFYISGIGTCHAEDTGGAIVGYRVDVWVPTLAEAYALTGWRTVTWGSGTQQVQGYRAAPTSTPVPPPTLPPPTATATAIPTSPSATVQQRHRPRAANHRKPIRPHRSLVTATPLPTNTPFPTATATTPAATTTPVPSTTAPAAAPIKSHRSGCHTIDLTTYRNGRPHHQLVTICT